MSAVFSPCRTWRYTLTRMVVRETGAMPYMPDDGAYPSLRTCLFICLNPSTADEVENDQTVRKCIGYVKRWGFDRMVVCNIFSIRSKDPRVLYDTTGPEIVGPENDKWIIAEACKADRIVLAWGNHGKLNERGDKVRILLLENLPPDVRRRVYTLGFNASGEPKHPLYLRSDLEPQQLWS